MSLATWRTAPRRSRCLPSFLRAGSSRIFTARSIWVLSWSVGAPAQDGLASSTSDSAATSTSMRASMAIEVTSCSLHLAEYVLGQQLFEIDGRLDLPELAVRGNDLLGAARADADVLLTDQALGLDRRDRVLLELDPCVHAERDAGLVVGQPDRHDAADLDPRDLHGRARLEPPH